jgi:hypothetical protein
MKRVPTSGTPSHETFNRHTENEPETTVERPAFFATKLASRPFTPMLLDIPQFAAAGGLVLAVLLLFALCCGTSSMEKHCKRVKCKAEEEQRCCSYNFGMITAGCVIMMTGCYDLWHLTSPDVIQNRLMASPLVSIAIGIFGISIGSSPVFVPNDAKISMELKLISVIWLWVLAFAVWDRARPPLLTLWTFYGFTALSSVTMIIFPDLSTSFNCMIIFSFMILCCLIELGSVGYGAVSVEQYSLGYASLFLGGIGLYLQAIPLEFASKCSQSRVISVFFAWALLHGYLQGSVLIAVAGIASLVTLLNFPSYANTISNWCTSLSIMLWWYMLRVRPGDPPMHFFNNYEIFAIALFALFKLNIRRLLVYKSYDNILTSIWVENWSIWLEKSSLCLWAVHLLFLYPPVDANWYFDTLLCWTDPAIPNYSLNLYYLVNIASSVEDVMWWVTAGGSTPRYFSSTSPSDYRNGKDRDAFDNKLIGLYHLIMAGLLIGSYLSSKSRAAPPPV